MYIISGPSIHLIIVSFLVYIVVNVFENLIHYNIGKFSNKETKFEIPTQKDWIKIIIVMCVFALIQGLLTYWFQKKIKLI
jgi:membrane protein DedA with SNARE-associated domain